MLWKGNLRSFPGFRSFQLREHFEGVSGINGPCFYTELALRRPQTFQKISEFLPKRFSQRWIPKLQFWYPPLRFGFRDLFSVVCTADFGSPARGQIFPRASVTKIWVAAPAPYKNPNIRNSSGITSGNGQPFCAAVGSGKVFCLSLDIRELLGRLQSVQNKESFRDL